MSFETGNKVSRDNMKMKKKKKLRCIIKISIHKLLSVNFPVILNNIKYVKGDHGNRKASFH